MILNGFTFDRGGSEAYVEDFEGLIKNIPADVQAVEGARVVTNLIAAPNNIANWATSGTTPPSLGGSVTYKNKVATQSITFDDTMTDTGWGGCRVSTWGTAGGQWSVVAGRKYRHTMEICLSRNLEGIEAIRFYGDVVAWPNNQIDNNVDFTEWMTICTDARVAGFRWIRSKTHSGS